MGVKKKIKLILIGIWGLFLLSVGAYAANSAYKNYQETQVKQAKEQHKNEQIEQAKEKVKKVVDDKISGIKCDTKYELKNSSDSDITIAITLYGRKNTNIDCKFDRIDDSIDFNDENSFEKVLNKFVDEEKTSEIRHTAIYDYQDMLYGMRGKMNTTWDKVKFSKNDDDYIIQETSDRFFSGDKAYLVTIDSEWISKNGYSEWKHICLHMEYDSNNKLLGSKYGDYDKINTDNDIKNGVKVDTGNIKASLNSSSNKMKSGITQKDAIEIVKKERNVDENVSSVNAFSDLDKTVDGVKYYHIEVVSKGGHGAASTCYVNSQTGEELDLMSNKDKYNKISNSK